MRCHESSRMFSAFTDTAFGILNTKAAAAIAIEG
jgi:hypothetical protein